MLLPAVTALPNFVSLISTTMKAAVIYEKGGLPQYSEYAEPIIQNEDEIILTVKAAAIKHIDKSRASGKHYSTATQAGTGTIIGGDGVGILEDGRRVYAIGVSGMVAERAIIEKSRMVPVPDNLDDVAAAALPNAIIGSAMALRFRGDIQKGDTVLINGATGFTGKAAVQIARHYCAKRVIATGRNEQTLNSLLELGADVVVSLNQDDALLLANIKAIHEHTPINVIVDYLWGHSAEIILAALKGEGSFTPKTRFVSVGSVTGDFIQLSAANLRSVDLQLSGSGLGSWTKTQMQLFFSEILPEMFQLAAEGLLKIDTIAMDIKDIETLWDMQIPDGKRLVVTI